MRSAPRQLQWPRVRTTRCRDVHADIIASGSQVQLGLIIHQAELAALRPQNDLFKSEQQRLESGIEEVEVRSRQQERRIQQLESSAPNSRYYHPSTPPRQSSSS